MKEPIRSYNLIKEDTSVHIYRGPQEYANGYSDRWGTVDTHLVITKSVPPYTIHKK